MQGANIEAFEKFENKIRSDILAQLKVCKREEHLLEDL